MYLAYLLVRCSSGKSWLHHYRGGVVRLTKIIALNDRILEHHCDQHSARSLVAKSSRANRT